VPPAATAAPAGGGPLGARRPVAPARGASLTIDTRQRPYGWRSGDILRAAALVGGFGTLAGLLWFARTLVFVVFLAVLFGLAVGAAVDRMEGWGLPGFRRGVASALLVFGSVGGLATAGVLMAPTITDQVSLLRVQVPAAVVKAQGWLDAHKGGVVGVVLRATPVPGVAPVAPAAAPVPGARTPGAAAVAKTAAATAATLATTREDLQGRLSAQFAGAAKYLFPVVSSTLTVIGAAVLIIFLAIYIGAEPHVYHQGLLHLFPHPSRARAGAVLSEVATVLRKWLVMQLVAMGTVGAVTLVAMLLLDVKAAFALGFIAALLEFIPTVGPVLAAAPAVAMGFVDSPEKAVAVLVVCWVIQFLENNLLIPKLMRDGMDIPPALTLVAQALFTLVFGFIGLMVAVPVTAALLVAVKMLYVTDVVGDVMPLMSEDAGVGEVGGAADPGPGVAAGSAAA
jgi:predicted PurR-regulated permease PerM